MRYVTGVLVGFRISRATSIGVSIVHALAVKRALRRTVSLAVQRPRRRQQAVSKKVSRPLVATPFTKTAAYRTSTSSITAGWFNRKA